MALTDDFAEALQEIEDPDLVPTIMTWAGADYPCFASGATRGGKLETFGWAVDDDLVIIVRGKLFPGTPRPEKGQTLECRGIRYGIERVMTAPAECFLRIACVNASKGA